MWQISNYQGNCSNGQVTQGIQTKIHQSPAYSDKSFTARARIHDLKMALCLSFFQYLSDAFSSTQSQNVSSSLFDDYDFLIILLAIFGTLIGAGLVWEYFYFRPKVERINKVNCK